MGRITEVVTKLGDPAKLQELYQALDVQMLYKAEGRTVDVTIRPKGRDKAGVRGGLELLHVASLRSSCAKNFRGELLDRALIWNQACLWHALCEYERHHNEY